MHPLDSAEIGLHEAGAACGHRGTSHALHEWRCGRGNGKPEVAQGKFADLPLRSARASANQDPTVLTAPSCRVVPEAHLFPFRPY